MLNISHAKQVQLSSQLALIVSVSIISNKSSAYAIFVVIIIIIHILKLVHNREFVDINIDILAFCFLVISFYFRGNKKKMEKGAFKRPRTEKDAGRSQGDVVLDLEEGIEFGGNYLSLSLSLSTYAVK